MCNSSVGSDVCMQRAVFFLLCAQADDEWLHVGPSMKLVW